MSHSLTYIQELLHRHFDEAAEGLVDKPPSQLCRGEGTEKRFHIMKIDLVGSTQLLSGRTRSTYLKLAHTFLSTVAKIAHDFGADPNQTEYAGDSVLAYFLEGASTAENVLTAACYARAAVQQIHNMKGVLGTLQLKCKIVLHFDTLIVSKIGPRANSIITAIGHPIHLVAKLEKEISANTGRATSEFFLQLRTENRKFLKPVYEEKKVPIIANTNPLASLLYPQLPSLQPQFTTEKKLIGFDLQWLMLYKTLELL